MFFLIKIFFLSLFVIFLHRLFLAYRLMKKIRDEVLIKGKPQSRYYGFGNRQYRGDDSYSSKSQQKNHSEANSKSCENIVEAEYKVIK